MGKLMKKKNSHQGFTGGGQTICSALTQEQRHALGRQACCCALPAVCHGKQDTPPQVCHYKPDTLPQLVIVWMMTHPLTTSGENNAFWGGTKKVLIIPQEYIYTEKAFSIYRDSLFSVKTAVKPEGPPWCTRFTWNKTARTKGQKIMNGKDFVMNLQNH